MNVKEMCTAFGLDMSEYSSGGRLDMEIYVQPENGKLLKVVPIITSDHGYVEGGVEYQFSKGRIVLMAVEE